MGMAMSGVLDPRLHYHVIHEFTHAISSTTPAYLAIRMLRLEAMLLYGSFGRMQSEGKEAVDLRAIDPELIESSLARFLAAEYLQAYLSPAFEGIACFAELNVTPSRKDYQFFRPLKELFGLIDDNIAVPPWRSHMDPVSIISKSDREKLKREILENPAHRSGTRTELLNQPIQDQGISGGYMIGYNWVNALYPGYQRNLDPEEFVYALIDLFFFDLELCIKAIDVDSIDKANDLHQSLRGHIFRILSGETAIEGVIHRRNDLPGFYTCPFMWPGHPCSSLRYSVSDLERLGGRMQANLGRINRFMGTIQYKNKTSLFLTVMADPLITISSTPISSMTPRSSGCIVRHDSDGETPFEAELDAFSWKKDSNGESRLYYGLLLGVPHLKQVVGAFREKDRKDLIEHVRHGGRITGGKDFVDGMTCRGPYKKVGGNIWLGRLKEDAVVVIFDADRITADRIGDNGFRQFNDRDVIQSGGNARHLARLDDFGRDVRARSTDTDRHEEHGSGNQDSGRQFHLSLAVPVS
jgi:hypothetical protein